MNTVDAPNCCVQPEPEHLEDLPHVYQFDFDLFQCKRCSAYWVKAWRMGMSGWEPANTQDAEQMQKLNGIELRAFMKQWAQSFN
jgi:hypothetical protein